MNFCNKRASCINIGVALPFQLCIDVCADTVGANDHAFSRLQLRNIVYDAGTLFQQIIHNILVMDDGAKCCNRLMLL